LLKQGEYINLLLLLIGPVKASIPIQESLGQTVPNSAPEKITDIDIQELVSLIRMNSKSWSKLAIRLKVKMKKIGEIRNAYPGRHDQACKAMLQSWRDTTENPLTRSELEKLIEGL